MATRIRRLVRPHLYLEEWIEFRGLNPATLAGRMERDRTTVWRWVKEQDRLNPSKMAEIAHALDLEIEELFRPPPRRSLDAMLKDQSEDIQDMAADIVSRLIKRAS